MPDGPETAAAAQVNPDILRPWIRDTHIENGSLHRYQEAFSSSPARTLSIKELLHESVAMQLARCLEGEIDFRTTCSIYPGTRVTEEEWLREDESKRFFRFSQIAGIRPEFQMSPNVLTYLRFRKAFLDPQFIRFFEVITGLPLRPTDDFSVHRMRRGDFLRIHNDVHGTRRLAFVMYLTPGWKPSFGGSLNMRDSGGGTTSIPPDYNSMVIFDVKADTQHFVEEISHEVGEGARLSIGGWFHEPE